MKVKVLGGAITGLLVLALMASGAAIADDGDGHRGQCELQGSWMGYDQDGLANFVATHSGASPRSGTSMMESPVFDLTLGGAFATAAKTSVGRGSWEKIGSNTYAWTAIGLAVDSQGNALYLWKIAAINQFSRDCNTVWVPSSSIEFFYAFANPYEDDPFYTYYGTPHTGMRITVDRPAVP